MNPDLGWLKFLFEHGPGGFVGAIGGGFLMALGPVASKQNPLIVGYYRNALTMRVSVADYTHERYRYIFYGGFVGAALGVAAWEFLRSWYKSREEKQG